MGRYTITKEEKYQYGSVLVLEEMINFKHNFPVLLEGNDKVLEPLFILMMSKDLVEIKNNHYVPTQLGRDKVVEFMTKFTEYLNIYDIFCSVDLEKAEFAFSSWYDFTDDDVWNEFLNQERFEDVRVAVCEFKGINPVEMVFMSFVASKVFDMEREGWQFDITSGLMWDDLIEICNTNISKEQLDEQNAMEAIVEGGMTVMKENKKKQAELDAEDAEMDDIIENPEYEDVEVEVEGEEEYYVEVVEDVIFEREYYDPYYDDIFYVSPLWVVPLLFI